MSIIFLFVDGVGLGANTEHNPLLDDSLQSFRHLTGGAPFTGQAAAVASPRHTFTAVDANLTVEGLPQSGTGQAALFTGQNTAQKIGKHFGPFPHSGIKPLLQSQSLFHKVQALGKTARFINAYPDLFFEKARERQRWTCTTLMAKSANLPLFGEAHIRNETAVTADLTQAGWRSALQIDVPQITPQMAAARVLAMATTTDVLLHEYYLTDKAGHSQNAEKARAILHIYDAFLWALINQCSPEATLVLCSDHGNLEDMSIKTHTRNPVPLVALGPAAPYFGNATSIMDVSSAIVQAVQNEE